MTESKLVNAEEFLRWYREGWSYRRIVDAYREKYNIEISAGTPANWLVQLGEPTRRNVWNPALLPWSVRPHHRQAKVYRRLQAEARRRAGYELPDTTQADLEVWLASLQVQNVVIQYDPNTEEGWLRVPRLPSDTDIVRLPGHTDRRLQRS